MNPIINSSLNKHPMSWDLINIRLLHPSGSIIKSMCLHQNLTSIPENCLKKINQAPFKICYTAKIIFFTKGTTVDTTSLQPGEPIHMYSILYNMNPITGFTSILTVVCAKTSMLWVFPTESKQYPIQIISLSSQN